jgi:hypothetical protein
MWVRIEKNPNNYRTEMVIPGTSYIFISLFIETGGKYEKKGPWYTRNELCSYLAHTFTGIETLYASPNLPVINLGSKDFVASFSVNSLPNRNS